MGDKQWLFSPVVITRRPQRLSAFVLDRCDVATGFISKMYVLAQKPLRKWMSIFFQHFFHTVYRNFFWSQDIFFFLTYLFWGKNAFTHTFTFQPCFFITPRWRWQIYLWLHSIWAQSEKFAISSARLLWRHLSIITWLLADSGWTGPQIIIFPLFLLVGIQYCQSHVRRTVTRLISKGRVSGCSSQTVGAMVQIFWEKVSSYNLSPDMCNTSFVTCHVSHVTCHHG